MIISVEWERWLMLRIKFHIFIVNLLSCTFIIQGVNWRLKLDSDSVTHTRVLHVHTRLNVVYHLFLGIGMKFETLTQTLEVFHSNVSERFKFAHVDICWTWPLPFGHSLPLLSIVLLIIEMSNESMVISGW